MPRTNPQKSAPAFAFSPEERQLDFSPHLGQVISSERPRTDFRNYIRENKTTDRVTEHHLVITVIAGSICIAAITLSIYKIIGGEVRRSSVAVRRITCIHEECESAVNDTYNRLSTHYDPCNYFFEYTCNSWSQGRSSFLQDAADRFQHTVDMALRTGPSPKPKEDGAHLLYNFYKSCYNFMMSNQSLSDIVKSTTRRFEGLTSSGSSSEALLRMITLALHDGLETLFSVQFTTADQKEMLHFSAGKSIRKKLEPISSNISYYEYLTDVLSFMQESRDITYLNTGILYLDSQMDTATSYNASTEIYSFSQLEGFITRLSVTQLLDAINSKLTRRHQQSQSSIVIITGRPYITRLSILFTGTDTKISSTYVILQAAMNFLEFDYFRRNEVQRPQDRVEKCLDVTRTYLPYTWPTIIEEMTFTETTRNTVAYMFRGMKNATMRIVQYKDWMEIPSRLEAAMKIRRTDLVMVTPYRDSGELRYKDYRLPGTFEDDYVFMVGLQAKKKLQYYRTDEQDIYGGYKDVSVSYLENRVVYVPIALMKPPVFYSARVGVPFNYGSLGTIMGVAIASAIGPKGSNVMRDGTEENWWTDDTKKSFQDRARCLINQYHLLRRSEDAVSYDLLEDVFVWTYGVMSSYSSYKALQRTSTRRAEKAVQDQLFFLRACMLNCNFVAQEGGELPYKYRCILPLMNTPEFAEAFACKVDSVMRPRNRCFL